MKLLLDSSLAGTRLTTNLAALYFAIQGFLGAAWWTWLWLWANPADWVLFWPAETPHSVQLAFVLPDVILFVAASLLASIGIAAKRSWSQPVNWIVVGAVAYAALLCVAITVISGEAIVGSASMVAALLGSLWSAKAVRQ